MWYSIACPNDDRICIDEQVDIKVELSYLHKTLLNRNKCYRYFSRLISTKCNDNQRVS